MEPIAINFSVALRTTVLLVEPDVYERGFWSLALKKIGFSVIAAGSPAEAISILNGHLRERIDVAVVDYEMPAMNGSILAEYLKSRYPQLKVIVYSGALDIFEEEAGLVDAVIQKSDGVGPLIGKIAELGPIDSGGSGAFTIQANVFMSAASYWC
jgi:CheY-like chemotaxis protein